MYLREPWGEIQAVLGKDRESGLLDLGRLGLSELPLEERGDIERRPGVGDRLLERPREHLFEPDPISRPPQLQEGIDHVLGWVGVEPLSPRGQGCAIA